MLVAAVAVAAVQPETPAAYLRAAQALAATVAVTTLMPFQQPVRQTVAVAAAVDMVALMN